MLQIKLLAGATALVKLLVAGSLLLGLANANEVVTDTFTESSLRFTARANGEYHFDTGVIAGKLRAGGESVGPAEVIYQASGQVISRVYGWLNHYRVFSEGMRYGRGMRHLPSEVSLNEDGSLTVLWPAEKSQPFEMAATYRWAAPHILDVDTKVTTTAALAGFELFLASYFPATFVEVRIPVIAADGIGITWLDAKEEQGYRQAFARDAPAVELLSDGRWDIEPHPIAWTLQPQWVWRPMSLRRDPQTGVTVIFMADLQETFAVYSPHSLQRHYALYYSLFGRNLTSGEVATARTRAVVLHNPDEQDILREAEAFFGQE